MKKMMHEEGRRKWGGEEEEEKKKKKKKKEEGGRGGKSMLAMSGFRRFVHVMALLLLLAAALPGIAASPLPLLSPETSWLLTPLLSSFLMIFVILFFQCGTSNAMAVFAMFLMCYFMLPLLYVLMRTN